MNTDELIPHYEKPFESILILGAPGSGKGTLGKFLSSAGNHFHLSSGDIFRGLSLDSPAGKLYHEYAGKGHLVPDEITVQIWHQYMQGLISTNRYFPKEQLLLLDGLPRTVKQAELLTKYIDIQKIIVLEMENKEKLIKRLQRRALIERRMDDMDISILKTRMEIYENDTKKVLSYYPKNLLATFNVDQKPLEVLRDVLVELSGLLSK